RLTGSACRSRMVVLDEDAVEQRAAVVESSACANGRFLQRAHPRRGLAGVEQARLRSLERLRVSPREGRDATETLEQGQRRPLGSEDRAQRAADAQDAISGSGGFSF